jgi:hypothetical protein
VAEAKTAGEMCTFAGCERAFGLCFPFFSGPQRASYFPPSAALFQTPHAGIRAQDHLGMIRAASTIRISTVTVGLEVLVMIAG